MRGAGHHRKLGAGRPLYVAIACSSVTSSSSPVITSVRLATPFRSEAASVGSSQFMRAKFAFMTESGRGRRAIAPRSHARGPRAGWRVDRSRGGPSRRGGRAGNEDHASGKVGAAQTSSATLAPGLQATRCRRPADDPLGERDRVLRHQLVADRAVAIRGTSVAAPLRCEDVPRALQRQTTARFPCQEPSRSPPNAAVRKLHLGSGAPGERRGGTRRDDEPAHGSRGLPDHGPCGSARATPLSIASLPRLAFDARQSAEGPTTIARRRGQIRRPHPRQIRRPQAARRGLARGAWAPRELHSAQLCASQEGSRR